MAYNIVDVSNVLHVGDKGAFSNFSITDVNGNEIPTGGIYALLNLFRSSKYNFLNDYWIFCFDRKSFRKDLSSISGVGYKSTRLNMPSHLFVQSQEVEKWLTESGFNTFAFDGYEADDIIATIALALKGTGTNVNIISADRDFSYLVDDFTSVISPNPRVPSIYKGNYNAVAGKKGHRVFYNTSLLYKVICGDSSDNIPSITRNAYALYNNMCFALDSHGVKYEQLNNFELLETYFDSLPEPMGSRALDNWQFIKPRLIDDSMLDFKEQNVDREELHDFLSLYSMKSIANKFNIQLTGETKIDVMKYRLELFERMFGTFEDVSLNDFSDETADEIEMTALQQIEEIQSDEDAMKEGLAKAFPSDDEQTPYGQRKSIIRSAIDLKDLKIGEEIVYGNTSQIVCGNFLSDDYKYGIVLRGTMGNSSTYSVLELTGSELDVYSDNNIKYTEVGEPEVTNENDGVTNGKYSSLVKPIELTSGDTVVVAGDKVLVTKVDHNEGMYITITVKDTNGSKREIEYYPLSRIERFENQESNSQGVSTDFRQRD